MRSRVKIMVATRELIESKGFDAVTIAAVAERAGVSRQTVYTIFGSREELVSQTVAERLTSLVERFGDVMTAVDTAVGYVVELIVECRRVFRGDPLLGELLRTQVGNPLFDPGALARACAVAEEILGPMAERFPETAGGIEELAEITVHLGWAAVCLDDPAARPDDELRAFLTRWLAPALAR